MVDENKVPSNENEEEYHFEDEDIDKELSQLDEEDVDVIDTSDDMADDSESELDTDQPVDSAADVSLKAKLKTKLLGLVEKIKVVDFKNLTRKQMIMVVCGGIAVLFVFAKMLGGGDSASTNAAVSPKQSNNNSASLQSLGSTNQPNNFNKTASLESKPNVYQQPTVSKNYPVQQQHYEPKTTGSMFAANGAVSSQVSASQNVGNNAALEATHSEIKLLKANNDKIATQINIMSSKISSLESDLGSINHQLLMIGDKIQTAQLAPSNAASSRSKDQKSAESRQAHKPKTESQTRKEYRRPASASSDTKYGVEAVVPGRAWLQASNGQTLSVTIGESIPGYGQVVAINAYNGDVTTSTGVVIKYSLGV